MESYTHLPWQAKIQLEWGAPADAAWTVAKNVLCQFSTTVAVAATLLHYLFPNGTFGKIQSLMQKAQVGIVFPLKSFDEVLK